MSEGAVAAATKDGADVPWPRKVWDILTPRERRQLGKLMPAVVMMALFETAGVASIVPFLGLLADPTLVDRNQKLQWAFTTFGFEDKETFFLAVGVAVLCLVTVGNIVSAATTWALLRFSWMRNHTIAVRLLSAYLRQPYEFFLTQNSADLGKNVLAEVSSVVIGVIVQGVQLSARLVVVIAVSAALFVIDPVMAAGVIVIFGGIYGALFAVVRRSVAQRGLERVDLNQRRYKIAQEALGGVKELQLYGLEPVAINEFSVLSHRYAVGQATNTIVAQLPKFAIESIAFSGVLIMVLYWLGTGRAVQQVLPVLGLYAFSAYRILPALQTVFGGLTQLRFNLGALDVLHRDLAGKLGSEVPMCAVAQRDFVDKVELIAASFAYQNTARATLQDISVVVGRGEWVAFVGPTGAGKSTLVDLLLGLLSPHSGCLAVDGQPVPPSERWGWQKNAAYVPQQIFLLDDSICVNVAFGVARDAIDKSRVEKVCQIAQIHDFVADLPNGYGTLIGERGVRLSGGQRQRLGIARALYRQPRFLVLDEATNALDGATETALFAALRANLSSCSVVSVAHRLTTTRDFDRIYVVERGRIVDVGSWSELRVRCKHFSREELTASAA